MLSRRFGRAVFGSALLLVAAYAFAPHITHRISTDAVVTADLVTLLAPIDGLAAPGLPAQGTRLPAGRELPLVVNLQAEMRELHRLRHEIASAEARRQALAELRGELARRRAELEARSARHAAASLARIAAEIAEAEAELSGRTAARERAAAERQRAEELRAGQVLPAAELEARRARLAEAVAAEDAARARIARLRVEQAAMREGLTLRDGHNDVPYSRQQAERLAVDLAVLEERIADLVSRIATLREALAVEERQHVDRVRFVHPLEAPMLVWARHVAPGTPVRAGQPVLDLVSCADLVVEVALPDSAFGAVEPGMPAQLLFRGGIALEGRVRELRGAGTRGRETPRAALLSGETRPRSSVLVSLPRDAAERLAPPDHEAESFCGIGRVAEVRFPARGWRHLPLVEELLALLRGGRAAAAPG
jgi:multidrug efflux pump subunit AcrA (membrane-fusion protein)